MKSSFCKGQVQMQEHLVVDEADAGAARVDRCRNTRAGVVQSIDAVDAGDDLIDIALVGAVGMAALCGLDLAECGLALNIVAGQITLQELIVEASGVLHRADGENLGRNVVSVVVEERQSSICSPSTRMATLAQPKASLRSSSIFAMVSFRFSTPAEGVGGGDAGVIISLNEIIWFLSADCQAYLKTGDSMYSTAQAQRGCAGGSSLCSGNRSFPA